ATGRSRPHHPVHGAGDRRAERAGGFGQRHRRGGQAGRGQRGPRGGGLAGQQAGQLGLDGGAQHRLAGRGDGQAVDDHAFDVQADVHGWAGSGVGQARSRSGTGSSSLRNSARAASSSSGMVTGAPAWAAANAALSAMLWILPPLAGSFARRSRSRPAVGVASGKTRSQIARRSARPGSGKVTTKRSRRRNAASSAPRRLVASTASPR